MTSALTAAIRDARVRLVIANRGATADIGVRGVAVNHGRAGKSRVAVRSGPPGTPDGRPVSAIPG